MTVDQPTLPAHDATDRRTPLANDDVRGGRVGRYVVLDKIGSGGMGVVWSAFDPQLDRKVAVKLLHEAGNEEATHASLLAEAQAMARLSHPNVVTVHDAGEHAGQVYLAMEHVQGVTLRQWLEQEPRSWQAVLDVFLHAGRGLAAAHAQELIHRDFKPDNVMVGDDGRVRVMDFGLARATGPSRVEESDEITATDRSQSVLATATVGVAGTPAYMAPEQHFGSTIGPAADQFAFCVAMWEALFGERPFAGETLPELVANVLEGKRRAPPKSQVPGWLRRAMARGLLLEPEDRWPSIDAMLSALEGDQTRGRRRWTLGAAGIVVGLGGLAYLQHERDRAGRIADCRAAGDEIFETWNQEARTRLREGFVATGLSYADATAERVEPWLDAWAEAWQTARADTCIAASVDGRIDEAREALTIDCLAERRMHFEAFVDGMREPDERLVDNAISDVALLPRVELCSRSQYLELRPPLAGPDLEQARALKKKMAEASMLLVTLRHDQAVVLGRENLELARRLSSGPLEARATYQLGVALSSTGEHEEAARLLTDAYVLAGKARDAEFVAVAARTLVRVVGHDLARVSEGLVWARAAEVAELAMGPVGELYTADRLFVTAHVLKRAGDFAESERLLEESLATYEEVLGTEHPRVAAALHNLAATRFQQGEHSESLETIERALAIRERLLGPGHPRVAASLQLAANIHRGQGDYERALAELRKVLEIHIRAYGPDSERVAVTLDLLSAVHKLLGEYDEAGSYADRALRIRRATLPPDHPDIAAALNTRANLDRTRGHLEQAKTLYLEALDIWERSSGPEHVDVAVASIGLARTLVLMGQDDEAEAHARRALAIWDRGPEGQHTYAGYPLTALATIALRRERYDEAVEYAQRAVQIREQGECTPEELAESRFVLAQALWLASAGIRDRDRARALALGAAEVYRKSDTGGVFESVIEEWLTAHPLKDP